MRRDLPTPPPKVAANLVRGPTAPPPKAAAKRPAVPPPPLSNRRNHSSEYLLQSGKSYRRLTAQMDPQDSAPVFAQCFEITQGLGAHQHSEGIWLTGNPGVLSNVRGKHKKKPLVRSPFVKLAGRVQVTRTVAYCRGDSHPVPHKHTNPPQSSLVRFIFGQVGENAQVTIPGGPLEKQGQRLRDAGSSTGQVKPQRTLRHFHPGLGHPALLR